MVRLSGSHSRGDDFARGLGCLAAANAGTRTNKLATEMSIFSLDGPTLSWLWWDAFGTGVGSW